MENKYLRELFRAEDQASPVMVYRDFFRQTDAGTPKGTLLIYLASVR